jgi:hypothetical protein
VAVTEKSSGRLGGLTGNPAHTGRSCTSLSVMTLGLPSSRKPCRIYRSAKLEVTFVDASVESTTLGGAE